MTGTIKPFMLKAVEKVHLALFQKELPDDLAIYFHELEPWQASRLDEALSFFSDLGYRTVHPYEFIAPRQPGDRRLFVSFDDNFRGWHRALDLFARRDARCTFYVNTGMFRDVADRKAIADYFSRICYRGEDRTLSRVEIREMHAAGHNIGCHTHNHPMLARLPRDRWDGEIATSKQILEDLVGARVRDFSYPFGMRRHFSPALREYCTGLGFRTIATGISGLQHGGAPDALNLHRTGWRFDLSLEDNLSRLRVSSPLYAGLTGRCAVGGSNWLALPLVW